MATVGDLLREAREAKGLSLQQVENTTRIRLRLLQALEENDFAALPAPVFVKGFLRNYAQLLELDADQVLEMYKAQAGDEAIPFRPTALTEPLETGRAVPRVLGVPVLLAVIALLAWVSYQQGWIQIPTLSAVEERLPRINTLTAPLAGALATATSPTAPPSITPTAVASPTHTATGTTLPSATAVPATATATLSPTSAASPSRTALPSATATVALVVATDGIQVDLEFATKAWLRVYTDGKMVFEGFAEKDTTQSYEANDSIYVHCGYGSGVRAIVNGQEYGPIHTKPDTVHIEWRLAPGPLSVNTDAKATQVVLSGGALPAATDTPSATGTRTSTPTRTPTR